MDKSGFRYVCLLVFLCLIAAQVSAQQSGNVTWTMALLNARTNESIPFSAPVQSRTGERFRLVIQAEADSFCYIIAESPTGEVVVVYSGPLRGGEMWRSNVLELTAPGGSESLFIIVSRDSQRTLNQRITALQNNNGRSQRRALMNEVFRIRGDVSRFREAPEVPVLMGGAARGAETQGIEFSGLTAYVKTINIVH